MAAAAEVLPWSPTAVVRLGAAVGGETERETVDLEPVFLALQLYQKLFDRVFGRRAPPPLSVLVSRPPPAACAALLLSRNARIPRTAAEMAAHHTHDK